MDTVYYGTDLTSTSVGFVGTDGAPAVGMLGNMFHPDTLCGQGGGQPGQIAVFLKVNGGTLLVTVGGNLAGDTKINQYLSLDGAPTVARVAIELDFKGL